jgi:hypothetical protein
MFLANKLNKGAGTPAAPVDAQFNYVTMLLHGDGTNGAQNNTFLDSSTNNFTITRNGNTTQGSFSPYGSNWSNYFDGTGDYLTAPDSAALDFGTGNFTMEAWVYATNLSNSPFLMHKSTGNGTNTGWFIELDAGNAYFGPGTTGSTFATFTSSAISTNNWFHIAVTRVSTTLQCFVNGTSIGTSTLAGYGGSKDNAAVFGIGSWAVVSSAYDLAGYISNLRVVKGTAVYTSNFTPSTTPLTAISGTSLLTCQSNRFIDNSTSPQTITAYGTPSVQRFNPFGASTAYSTSVIGGSGYFDGTGDYLTTPSSSALGFGTGDFTIECWTYLRDSNALYVFDMRFSSGADTYVYITATALEAAVNGVSLSVAGVNFLNNWAHIAVVRASGTVKIYVNGVQQATDTSSGSIANSGIAVGARFTGSESFNGYISNFRIVKGTAVYTSAFTPPTAPLTAITNTSLLLNYINGAIFDNAMMNDLETVGNAQISTSVVKYGTGSLSFDGTGDALYSTSQSVIFGTGDFTLEFWIYFNAVNNSTVKFIYDMRNSGATSASFLAQEAANTWTYWNGAGTSISSGFTSSTFTASTWTHVAICRSSGTTRFFAGGTLANSASDTSNYANSTLTFGARYSISDALNGYIDDLRITKGYARYTANFTPPTVALPDIGPV